jgi:hypothetical protein
MQGWYWRREIKVSVPESFELKQAVAVMPEPIVSFQTEVREAS